MSIQERIANRIEQYIPDLRKQIRIQILKQLTKTNKQILQQKTNQIRELYTNKLKAQAQQIKSNINSNMIILNKQLTQLNSQIADVKNRKLTDKEKEQIVQDTLDEVVGDERMLDEIKIKLYPKVEEAVFFNLQSNLQAELEEYQNQQQDSYERARFQWEKQRYQYWRAQSERSIEQLAEEHKQLECKKTLIIQSLTSKKAERDSLLRQQNSLIETNNQISFLKAQIKLLS